jgi:hypothetical protein
MTVDEEQLRVLSVVHYVFGGLKALGGCAALAFLAFGIAIASHALNGPGNGQPPQPEVGIFFIIVGGVLALFLWASALALFVAGRFLCIHKGYAFCIVVAAIECLSFPFGTILGVLTIVVLMRPTVQAMFGRGVQKAYVPNQEFL